MNTLIFVKDKTYLTTELIENIQQKAKDPIYKMGFIMLTKNWYDIISVSPINLIHFVGNSDTGWKHINERHGFYSDTNYFGYGKIREPSKYTRTSIPIHDYVNVADDIFISGIKETIGHKKEDIFEKYSGKSNRYTGSDGSFKDFCLILYKGTHIVHSLYPENDLAADSPKRTLRDFARCRDKITSTQKLIEDILTISIPYENKKKVIRYVIIIRLDEYTLKGNLYLQVNNYMGVPLFTLFPELCTFNANLKLSKPLSNAGIEFTRFMNGLGFADFTAIEEQMLKVEEHLKNKIDKT